MTRQEQQDLARELASNFAEAYVQMATNAPEEWTGFELRALLQDCARERFHIHMDRARTKAYRNARAINPNL